MSDLNQVVAEIADAVVAGAQSNTALSEAMQLGLTALQESLAFQAKAIAAQSELIGTLSQRVLALEGRLN